MGEEVSSQQNHQPENPRRLVYFPVSVDRNFVPIKKIFAIFQKKCNETVLSNV